MNEYTACFHLIKTLMLQ
uniref:Uncharacterized protein n=1 Tax=Anguilla anguilla TaxID=7936 RepID=A0A0E9R8E2_ANGAN